MIEEWRPVIGFEGLYEVSSLGRVRTLATGQERKAVKLASGYMHLQLYRDNRGHGKYIHTLVLEAFRSKRPFPKAEGRHLDDNKSNNALDNLDWGTTAQNRQDGLINNKNTQMKLTIDQVRYVRSDFPETFKTLAESWNVTEVTLQHARHRRTYKHIL